MTRDGFARRLAARLMPQSLFGQILAVVAAGLLIGQFVSAALLVQAAHERRVERIANTLAFRLAGAFPDAQSALQAPRAPRPPGPRLDGPRLDGPRLDGPRLDGPRPRAMRLPIERANQIPIAPSEPRLEDYERALADALERQGAPYRALAVTRRDARADPLVARLLERHPRLQRRLPADAKVIVAAVDHGDGSVAVLRLAEPRPQRAAIGRIVLQTLVIFAAIFVLLYLALRRITRPLARLTQRVGEFSDNPGKAVAIAQSGPSDLRQLIAAHNAMEARIAALLDEKDVMLGAIGHDLKTPLAAMRVRIEKLADEAEREQLARLIREMGQTLDDILALARLGRSGEAPEITDLGALVATLVDEYRDMGRAVELEHGERVALPLRETWVRRALRNLIDNALRYGERARVRVMREGNQAVVRIEDDGPGIAPAQIAQMLEPFRRGEASRNRATGGAGLGLTIAHAIAEQHGGKLRLFNRETRDGARSGLVAELRFPV